MERLFSTGSGMMAEASAGIASVLIGRTWLATE